MERYYNIKQAKEHAMKNKKKWGRLVNYLRELWHCSSSLKRRERERGMTLIEIMIVIMIILLLAGTVTVVAITVFSQSQRAAAKNQIKEFETGLGMYLLKCHTYPTQDQGLEALVKKPSVEPVPANWTSPFLNKLEIPKDPWDNPYEYTVPGPEGLPYGIRSFGADGKEGGEGDNEDIVSWK
jgi:general secretion pathway protein G